MSTFSLELNEDQLQIQKWVHDFAADVIRPAASRVGRARRDAVADHRGGRQDRSLLDGLHRQRVRRPDRHHVPDGLRGAGVGRRGHHARAPRHDARRVGHRRQRHARADRRVGAAVLRHRRRHPRRRVRGERSRRRLRRVVAAHARGLRRSEGRVGDQRHQDVDHQRRHHARAVRCTSSSPRSSPS